MTPDWWVGLTEDQTEMLVQLTTDDGLEVEFYLIDGEHLPMDIATSRQDREPPVHAIHIETTKQFYQLLGGSR